MPRNLLDLRLDKLLLTSYPSCPRDLVRNLLDTYHKYDNTCHQRQDKLQFAPRTTSDLLPIKYGDWKTGIRHEKWRCGGWCNVEAVHASELQVGGQYSVCVDATERWHWVGRCKETALVERKRKKATHLFEIQDIFLAVSQNISKRDILLDIPISPNVPNRSPNKISQTVSINGILLISLVILDYPI